MKTIWLVNPYGPIEGENWREYSFNQFGKFLSKNGFEVIWWTSSFSHHFKKQRANDWKDILVNENFIIRLVPTPPYYNNFGLGRLKKDVVFSKKAYKRFLSSKKPCLIISADNPITLSKPSFRFAKKFNIPIIYDQMDVWPEFIIRNIKNPVVRFLAKIALVPVISNRKKNYLQLSGSIALGKNYLSFMNSVCPSLRNKPSALVYNGIDVNEFRKHLRDETGIKLPEKSKEDIWCVFAGTLGPSYDIASIITVAKRLSFEKKGHIKFIIAGSGPLESLVKDALGSCNIIYLGHLKPEDLIPIYGHCDIGLSTYSSGSNVDMCDKFYDYTAAGLAIINSLSGEVSDYIHEKKVGKNYIPNDAESLYNAICFYLNKNALSNAKSNSYQLGELFDKNVQNAKLLDVIQKILNDFNKTN